MVEVAAGQQEGGTVAVRIGDAERERVRLVLSRHAEDGRITLEEYSDRLGEVYAARTTPELQEALRELPPLPLRDAGVLPAERAAAARRVRAGVAAYVGFVALMLAIWVVTGAGFFWPLWPIIGVGFGMARAVRAEDDQAQGRTSGPWGWWGFGACGQPGAAADRTR